MQKNHCCSQDIGCLDGTTTLASASTSGIGVDQIGDTVDVPMETLFNVFVHVTSPFGMQV
jgi:hypothetical protein